MKLIFLNKKKITYELALYFGILLLAALLRFPQLGNSPLNDFEAKLALSSIDLQRGINGIQSAQPLYLSLTSLLFIFASNNFTARIVSALAGCLFTITPFFFKKWIGRKESLLFGLFFALDPTLISISRQADSRMMTLFLFIVLIASILFFQKSYTGIISGLLLLCGPSIVQLLIPIVLSLFLFYQLSKSNKKHLKIVKGFISPNRSEFSRIILGCVITVVFIGTRLFSRPGLINLIPQSFISLINYGSVQGQLFNQISFLYIIFFSCYPLVFLLCFVGVIREMIRKDEKAQFVLILLLISFLFFLGNPNSKPVDIYFLLIPLYYFGIKSILYWIDLLKIYPKESLLIGIPVICLIGFIWLAVLRILNLPIGSIDTAQMFILLIGSMFLLGLIIVLLAWAWSLKAALSGLSLGIIFLLALFQISVGIHATGIVPRPESELWWLENYFSGSKTLTKTIEEISMWNTGFKNKLDVALVGIDSPSIEWALKEQVIEKFVTMPVNESPSIVIMKGGNELSVKSGYRGQNISLHSYPRWTLNLDQSLISIDFYRWLLLRDGMIKNEDAEIWARADLFIGNNIKFENNN
jgi:hypothetical protein